MCASVLLKEPSKFPTSTYYCRNQSALYNQNTTLKIILCHGFKKLFCKCSLILMYAVCYVLKSGVEKWINPTKVPKYIILHLIISASLSKLLQKMALDKVLNGYTSLSKWFYPMLSALLKVGWKNFKLEVHPIKGGYDFFSHQTLVCFVFIYLQSVRMERLVFVIDWVIKV